MESSRRSAIRAHLGRGRPGRLAFRADARQLRPDRRRPGIAHRRAARPRGVGGAGVKKVELVLLTHHHRDTCAAADKFLADGVPVGALKTAADWLTPAGVQKYWRESLPFRGSRTAYLVLPVGLTGIDCSLTDGQTITWRGWTVRFVATPGHSHDHVAFAVRKKQDDPWLICCGDALAEAGKLWAPYTTDWDHWTDAGLVPTAKSLRLLADLKPALLLPAHGPVIDRKSRRRPDQDRRRGGRTGVSEELRALHQEAARQRRRSINSCAGASRVQWLETVDASVAEPVPDWQHLCPGVQREEGISGSRSLGETRCRSGRQIFTEDQQLGMLEVVLFSHAHYDHYDGVFELPDREKFQIWALDRVAGPIAEPFRLRCRSSMPGP